MNRSTHSTDDHSIYSLTAQAWTRMGARRTVVRRLIKYVRVVKLVLSLKARGDGRP